jgi:hypothetical protein
MIKVEDGECGKGGGVRFMGRGGPANSTFRRSAGACELDFFACGWLARFIYGT